MNKELQKQILNERVKVKCYLISPNYNHNVNESIIPDMESYDLFVELDSKTQKLAKHFINEIDRKNHDIKIKLYLIYFGNENIQNITNFDGFINKNKNDIVGVYRHPTMINEDMRRGYILPYYEIGSFYFDFAQLLDTLKQNDIEIYTSSERTNYLGEINASLVKKRY